MGELNFVDLREFNVFHFYSDTLYRNNNCGRCLLLTWTQKHIILETRIVFIVAIATSKFVACCFCSLCCTNNIQLHTCVALIYRCCCYIISCCCCFLYMLMIMGILLLLVGSGLFCSGRCTFIWSFVCRISITFAKHLLHRNFKIYLSLLKPNQT